MEGRLSLMTKRVLLILLPVFLGLAILFGIYRAVKPKVQSWILSQVNRLSEEKSPVRVHITEVDWSFLFPEIQLRGISLESKEIQIPPVKIESVTASLDLLAALGGRIAISSLLVERPSLEIDIDPYLSSTTPKSDIQLPLDELFDLLKKVPISKMGLHQGNFLIQSEKLKFGLLLGSTDLLVLNKKEKLNLQLDFNDAILDFEKTGEVPFRIQGEAMLSTQTLDISILKIALLNSLVTANGSFSNLPNILNKPHGELDLELHSELDRLSRAAKNLMTFPNLQGKLDASGRLSMDGLKRIDSGFKVSAQKIKIDQFDIGDVQFQGSVQKDKLRIPKLELTNEAGLVDVKGFELGFHETETGLKLSVQGDLSTQQIDLNELLSRIGVGDLPLEVFVAAQLKCGGPVYPDAQMKCEGQASGEQLEVRTGDKVENTLVLVDEFAANGNFTITSKDVRYQADLKVKNDIGKSDGVVSFKDGFKINYSSPRFAFSNIRRLAGLKIEGESEVLGSVQGDSHAATFGMNLKTKGLYFEDFFLGDAAGRLAYEKGVLHFSDIKASFGTTEYVAQVDVDLNKSRVSARGQLPKMEINELLNIFSRRFVMPVTVSGIGSAQVSVEGPFALGKLSYDLEASLIRGSVVGETFDRLDLNLHSESGEMIVRRAKMTKAQNTLEVTGQGHPNGDIALRILGSKLAIEESENISKIGSQITGLLDVDANLKGFILTPDIQIQGRAYQLNIEEKDFAESKFKLELDQQSISGSTDLFAGQLATKFRIPLNDSGAFNLNLKANRWNYTTLFALIGGGSLLNEYKASLTGDLDLASDKGGLWAASGNGTISDFLLQRGGLSLHNRAPMGLIMSNGIASLNQFRIDGDQTYFAVTGKQISKDDLNLRLEAQANLRLFQIFLPFLEELGGQANVGADVSGALLKPEILGNGNIRSGFVKIKGFPHPFEKIQADLQFSQTKILINGFLGTIAGGTFEGDGSVVIAGPKNLPTSIKAHLENVNLNVPDHMKTSGSADMVFSGSWFPFTLSGTYVVRGGFVDKEFGGDSGTNNLKQSSYLPKIILQNAFEPVLLDLNILLEKPLTIRNSMVEGAVAGQILVKGAPTSPSLGGQLVTEKGTKVIIRDKSFDVLNGIVRFTGESDINPDLYVAARSRISDYDINMLIQGPAKNPVIRATSVPPLSEQDINSLIVLGVTSQSLDKSSGTITNEKVNSGLVSGLLTQFEPVKQFQRKTGVEIQISASDDTKDGTVQRVTLSKKLSERVKAAATQSSGSKAQTNEYTLQYNLTDNLSAIGRYEDRKFLNNSGELGSGRQDDSILGIDLEFKREFK
jgi:translocation and assembly module TamB